MQKEVPQFNLKRVTILRHLFSLLCCYFIFSCILSFCVNFGRSIFQCTIFKKTAVVALATPVFASQK